MAKATCFDITSLITPAWQCYSFCNSQRHPFAELEANTRLSKPKVLLDQINLQQHVLRKLDNPTDLISTYCLSAALL